MRRDEWNSQRLLKELDDKLKAHQPHCRHSGSHHDAAQVDVVIKLAQIFAGWPERAAIFSKLRPFVTAC